MKHVLIRYWPHIALSAFGILAWAILYPVYLRALENMSHTNCQSNLKQVGLAIIQYSQDNDERLPLIRVHAVEESLEPFNKPYGWADAIYPYLKSVAVYQCPKEDNFKDGVQDAVASGFTDYYYNSNCSGIKNERLLRPEKTILGGDGNDSTDGTDARYNRNVIPKSWLHGAQSPFKRHLDGGNFLFVDGHVKWSKPEKVKATRAGKNDFSFALR